ncbi:MAG: DUF2281 domain-containing protein [Oscillospiraceae bacterium]|nr:DUF2281 domain-containing protein [Oscillospiraceae bacterium]
MELRQQLHNDIELLPENTLRAVSVFLRDIVMVEFKPMKASVLTPLEIIEKRKASLGCMAGKMWVSEDFDAPLDEMREYME